VVVSATVHGFTVGYWWAAGAFWAGAVICGALIRGDTRLHHEAGQPEPVHQVVSGPIWHLGAGEPSTLRPSTPARPPRPTDPYTTKEHTS
jgi:hypothetical protein